MSCWLRDCFYCKNWACQEQEKNLNLDGWVMSKLRFYLTERATHNNYFVRWVFGSIFTSCDTILNTCQCHFLTVYFVTPNVPCPISLNLPRKCDLHSSDRNWRSSAFLANLNRCDYSQPNFYSEKLQKSNKRLLIILLSYLLLLVSFLLLKV